MTDKKSGESRRKLLKSIATGSGVIVAGKSLPENWTKPVVDTVMLPAHAQTTTPTPPTPPTLLATCNPADGSNVADPDTVTSMDLSATAPYPAEVLVQRICNGTPVVTFSPINLNSGEVQQFTISANIACGSASSGDTFGLRATRQDDNFVLECTWTYLAT